MRTLLMTFAAIPFLLVQWDSASVAFTSTADRVLTANEATKQVRAKRCMPKKKCPAKETSSWLFLKS